MKKVLQLCALLFVVALIAAMAPALPWAHFSASAATLVAQSQDPGQQGQPTTQSQAQPNQQPPDQMQQDPNQANPPADRDRLPRTGSPLPLLGLVGLISLGGVVVVRRISRIIS